MVIFCKTIKLGENGVAYVKLTQELLKQFDAGPVRGLLLVSALGNIQGIMAWIFFIEEEDQIRVRFRSKGPVINVWPANLKAGDIHWQQEHPSILGMMQRQSSVK